MPIDYSKLSDAALEQIADGKVDYSKLSDDDLAHIAEQAPEAHAPASAQAPSPQPAAQNDPGYGPTADGHMRNPFKVNWLGAIKHEFTKPLDPMSKAVFQNPLYSMAAPAPGAGAVAEGFGAGALNLAERAATSPLPENVSNATNMVGYGKSIATKVAESLGQNSPTAAKVIDKLGSVFGRAKAYSSPITGIPQGISDISKGVSYGQKGVAFLLDNADKLGKFGPVLKRAAQASPAALTATHFLLQQNDPEYQQVMKKMNENGDLAEAPHE